MIAGETAGSVVSDVLTFAACWVLGFVTGDLVQVRRVGDRLAMAGYFGVALRARADGRMTATAG